ncbi:MAG: nucleotide exchange factor GrpE [Clostridiales bacterium]|jgi:molecular chaperone GrpE|nr:nucleotide exchange factor GrpE [Clostridiales bacterium]
MSKREKKEKERINEKLREEQEEREDMPEEAQILDAEPEPDELSALKEQLSQKEQLAAENHDKYLRALAEFDNFRKRTAKEKTSMYDDGVKDTVEKLLPIIDNFERAYLSQSNRDDVFYKGISMIFKQLQDFLDYVGVEVIECVGEEFNPNFHNAVAHVDDENYGENEIVEELQKGYKYKEKIIRCSMVKVAN